MEIYKLYYKAMYNTSLNIVGNTAEAEDIMQESFLKAFKLLPATELSYGFGGWLKKIVVNKSLDLVRKRKIHYEEVEGIGDDRIDEDSFEIQGESVQEKIKRVKRAMTELPEKYRTVLSLSLFEGYDHDEISSMLGITTSTRLDEEVQGAEWGEYKKNHTMILRVVRAFRDLPMNVIFTAGEKYNQDETKKYKYTPDLTGQLAKKVQGFMDLVGYYRQASGPDGQIARRLFVLPSGSGRYDAKHRYQQFKGEYFDNPSLGSILKEVGLLDEDGTTLK